MPDLKENKRISPFWMSQGKPLYLRPTVSECFKDRGRKKAREEFIFEMSEQLPVSLSVLCAFGTTLGFYVSAFSAYCMCRLRLSCEDTTIWDS